MKLTTKTLELQKGFSDIGEQFKPISLALTSLVSSITNPFQDIQNFRSPLLLPSPKQENYGYNEYNPRGPKFPKGKVGLGLGLVALAIAFTVLTNNGDKKDPRFTVDPNPTQVATLQAGVIANENSRSRNVYTPGVNISAATPTEGVSGIVTETRSPYDSLPAFSSIRFEPNSFFNHFGFNSPRLCLGVMIRDGKIYTQTT